MKSSEKYWQDKRDEHIQGLYQDFLRESEIEHSPQPVRLFAKSRTTGHGNVFMGMTEHILVEYLAKKMPYRYD